MNEIDTILTSLFHVAIQFASFDSDNGSFNVKV